MMACMGTRNLPRLVIAGAGGVIGRHLIAAAAERFDTVVLTRSRTSREGATALTWDPTAARRGDGDALAALVAVLDGAAAVVNLAGSSIAGGRLGPRHIALVRDSRVDATTTLVTAASRCARPPAAWFQVSGTGIYGDGGERELDELAPADTSSPLGVVGAQWEAAAAPAASFSRLVIGRVGMVLAPDAVAWRRLLLPIRLFVGGPLGTGRQWWPWIHVDDLTRVILKSLADERMVGVYNVVAEPVRQLELTREAAGRLGRPAALPVPAFALRLLLGGVADALLLGSQRVVPARLVEEGYDFVAGTVPAAVARLVERRNLHGA
jgi:uncharacterized protein